MLSPSAKIFVYLFAITICPSHALSDSPNVSSSSLTPAGGPSPLPGKWVAEMFYQALANFTVIEEAATAECRRQTRMYVSQLRNNTYWAVKSKCIVPSLGLCSLSDLLRHPPVTGNAATWRAFRTVSRKCIR